MLLRALAAARGGRLAQLARACSSSGAPGSAEGAGAQGSSARQQLERAARVEDVMRVAEGRGESLAPGDVAFALEQVERCAQGLDAARKSELCESKTVQMLADMAVSAAARSQPEVVAASLSSLGRLGFSSELVLDELARALVPGVRHLEPQQLHSLVEGLAAADHSPGVVLLDQVADRLSGLGERVEAHQDAAIRDGLRRLGRSDDNLPNPEPQSQPDRIKYS